MHRKIVFLIGIYLVSSLAGDQHWFRNSEFQKHLDETTFSRSHKNNRVELIVNGIDSLNKRLQNIDEANFIFIKAYEFWNDETGGLILKKLLEKAQSGAKVFIQYDVKGTVTSVQTELKKGIREGKINPIPEYLQDFVNKSRGNGFVIPTSIPYSYLTNTFLIIPVDHEKYFITWNSKGAPLKVIMGGMNTGDMYLLSGGKNEDGSHKKVPFYEKQGFSGSLAYPMRDTDVQVMGTVTEDILSRFIDSARFQLKNPNPYFQKYLLSHVQSAIQEMEKIQQQALERSSTAFPKEVGDAFLRFIYVTAREYNTNNLRHISNFLVSMLKHVPDNAIIEFATGYLLPTKNLLRGIYRAAQRGVLFKILSNRTIGPESTIGVVATTAQSQIRSFLKSVPAGTVDFYEWLADEGSGTSSTHQKVFSFGIGENEPCCVGSSNLDSASLIWNSEGILVIQSPQFKRKLDEMLLKDFSHRNSRKITIPQMNKEPALNKWKGFIANRLFEDFL